MDPFSITTACVGLVASVTKVSIQINSFVRKSREARGDLDAVSRELVSLKTVLEILSEDAGSGKGFPGSLVKQISGILTNCGVVLEQIETLLQKYAGGGVSPAVKWAISGQDDMNKLRSSLEAHKSALDIAVDMVSLSLTREIKADTHEIRNDTSAIKEDTTQILAEIARLQARLPEVERIGGGNGFTLQRYLDNLTSYAESSWDISDIDLDDMAELEPPIDSSPSSGYKYNIHVQHNTSDISSMPADRRYVQTRPHRISEISLLSHDGKTRSVEVFRYHTPPPPPSPGRIRSTEGPWPGTYPPRGPGTLPHGVRERPQSDESLEKANEIYSLGSNTSSNNDDQTATPKPISGGTSRSQSMDRMSRKSTDSRRSISFGFGKKRSGSLSESESILQDKPRRFSLPPANVSLKAIGIGTDHGSLKPSPVSESQRSPLRQSGTPHRDSHEAEADSERTDMTRPSILGLEDKARTKLGIWDGQAITPSGVLYHSTGSGEGNYTNPQQSPSSSKENEPMLDGYDSLQAYNAGRPLTPVSNNEPVKGRAETNSYKPLPSQPLPGTTGSPSGINNIIRERKARARDDHPGDRRYYHQGGTTKLQKQTGSGGAAKKVMDFFRRSGRDRNG